MIVFSTFKTRVSEWSYSLKAKVSLSLSLSPIRHGPFLRREKDGEVGNVGSRGIFPMAFCPDFMPPFRIDTKARVVRMRVRNPTPTLHFA